MDTNDFIIDGKNESALFSLKVYRGEGMALIAMNWKIGTPTKDFVGFSIEYKEPNGNRYYPLKNRLSFSNGIPKIKTEGISSLLAPFQKFRWIHFPRNATMKGLFSYMVKPVFMNQMGELSYGEAQVVDIELYHETYQGKLNIAFTRGFVSSQAFVDKYQSSGDISTLLPGKADDGIDFKPSHPKTKDALTWMGFETLQEILNVLDEAINDQQAEVRVIAYDLNQPQILEKFVQLGNRLRIIIDDSGSHRDGDSAETKAAQILLNSTGGKVKRQHMSQLQHNKTIVVSGTNFNVAICGSTNFTWRGLFVQANNSVTVRGTQAIIPFVKAFDNYWNSETSDSFKSSTSAEWNNLGLDGINAKISFSPHSISNALLKEIASDLKDNTSSSVFYSLAFLFQTSGDIRDTILNLTLDENFFVYGISDKKLGGLELLKPNGNILPVYPSQLKKGLPSPFKEEPSGGFGTRMHHKFIVIDFDKPSARVYSGSYNFSSTADTKNGENLLLIKDRKIAISYMIEAIRLIDHYHFRVAVNESKKNGTEICLTPAPQKTTDSIWWEEYYNDPRKVKDRELFAPL